LHLSYHLFLKETTLLIDNWWVSLLLRFLEAESLVLKTKGNRVCKWSSSICIVSLTPFLKIYPHKSHVFVLLVCFVQWNFFFHDISLFHLAIPHTPLSLTIHVTHSNSIYDFICIGAKVNMFLWTMLY